MYQSSVAARHKVEGLLSLLQEGNDLADELTSVHHHWQPTNTRSAEVCSSRQNGQGSSAYLPSSQPNAQEEQQRRRRHSPSLNRDHGAAVTPSPLEAIDPNNCSMNVNELRKAIQIARLSANPLPYFTLGKGPREHTPPSRQERIEPPHHHHQQQQQEQEQRRVLQVPPPPPPSLSHFPFTSNPPSPIAKSSLNNSENW